MELKNVSDGPRGIHCNDGLVMVERGERIVIDDHNYNEIEVISAIEAGWFEEVGGEEAKKPAAKKPAASDDSEKKA